MSRVLNTPNADESAEIYNFDVEVDMVCRLTQSRVAFEDLDGRCQHVQDTSATEAGTSFADESTVAASAHSRDSFDHRSSSPRCCHLNSYTKTVLRSSSSPLSFSNITLSMTSSATFCTSRPLLSHRSKNAMSFSNNQGL